MWGNDKICLKDIETNCKKNEHSPSYPSSQWLPFLHSMESIRNQYICWNKIRLLKCLGPDLRNLYLLRLQPDKSGWSLPFPSALHKWWRLAILEMSPDLLAYSESKAMIAIWVSHLFTERRETTRVIMTFANSLQTWPCHVAIYWQTNQQLLQACLWCCRDDLLPEVQGLQKVSSAPLTPAQPCGDTSSTCCCPVSPFLGCYYYAFLKGPVPLENYMEGSSHIMLLGRWIGGRAVGTRCTDISGEHYHYTTQGLLC